MEKVNIKQDQWKFWADLGNVFLLRKGKIHKRIGGAIESVDEAVSVTAGLILFCTGWNVSSGEVLGLSSSSGGGLRASGRLRGSRRLGNNRSRRSSD